jgi:hypothetical protein
MKKKKVSLAILGVASLFATTPVKAQTFWQCMPEGCDAGEYLSGFRCKSCTHEDWCPGKSYGSYLKPELNKGYVAVKSLIIAMAGGGDGSNSEAVQKCKTAGKAIFDTLAKNNTETYLKNFIPALEGLTVKVGYDKKAYVYTSNTTYQSANDDLKNAKNIYETLPANLYFEYNCLELYDVSSNVESYINDKLYNEIPRAMNSFMSTMATTITTLYKTHNYDGTSYSITSNKNIGFYKAEIAGGGGGGGALSKYCGGENRSSTDGGDGGEIETAYFVLLNDDNSYTYTIGKGGAGGTGKGGVGWGVWGEAHKDEGDSNGNPGSYGTATSFKPTTGFKTTASGGRGGKGMRSYGSDGGYCGYREARAYTEDEKDAPKRASNGGAGRSIGSAGNGTTGGNGWIKIYKL